MDYLCYMNKEKIEELRLSKPIILQVEYKSKSDEICQVFENDFVYLATKERPRVAMLKCRVLSVTETIGDKAGETAGSEKMYFVGRKKLFNKAVGLIEVLPVKRIWLSIDPSLVFLRSHWQPVGNINTMI